MLDWLKEEYGVGRGHATAFYGVLKNGPTVSAKHVGSTGSHRDESLALRLDGIAAAPADQPEARCGRPRMHLSRPAEPKVRTRVHRVLALTDGYPSSGGPNQRPGEPVWLNEPPVR